MYINSCSERNHRAIEQVNTNYAKHFYPFSTLFAIVQDDKGTVDSSLINYMPFQQQFNRNCDLSGSKLSGLTLASVLALLFTSPILPMRPLDHPLVKEMCPLLQASKLHAVFTCVDQWPIFTE